ncbi:MAG TPA: alpha/beta hydrolase-fold protein [Pyrinomonadaceae bacterium]|nr:alpha/beta hydrolase-fold protein [Pyrinomonadaceae bacterium]
MITKISSVLLMAGLLCAGVNTATAQTRYLTEDHRLHKSFHSKFLPKDRDVIVWLPPGYDANPTKRYPVLYMQDGNTVFGLWNASRQTIAGRTQSKGLGFEL